MRALSPVLAVFSAAAAASMMGCGSLSPIPPTVEFVVPDGFHGPFLIIVDPTGEEIARSHNVAVLHIPDCGVLRVTDDAMLREMATWKARTESGTEIPEENLAAAHEVALRPHGWVSGSKIEDRYQFIVGTLADSETFDFGTYATPDCN